MIGQHSFDLAYALSRLTSGTNLLAFSTAVGWMLRSWTGALVVVLAASPQLNDLCGSLAVLASRKVESVWVILVAAMVQLSAAGVVIGA